MVEHLNEGLWEGGGGCGEVGNWANNLNIKLLDEVCYTLNVGLLIYFSIFHIEFHLYTFYSHEKSRFCLQLSLS